MIHNSKKMKFLSLILFAVGFVLINGNLDEVRAQKDGDPFRKPVWQTPKDPNAKTTTTVDKNGKVVTTPVKATPPPVVPVGVPAIQDRINYYKKLREIAAEKGETLPKVTSVLTLGEMSVMGIFRTPRGYAAMVSSQSNQPFIHDLSG